MEQINIQQKILTEQTIGINVQIQITDIMQLLLDIYKLGDKEKY